MPAEMQKAVALSGSFDAEKAQGFINPILDIIKSTTTKIKIDFTEDKTAQIRVASDGGDIICMLDYDNELFSDFALEKETSLCLYNASEFAGIVKLFTDEGFDLSYDSRYLNIKQDSNVVNYLGADESVIKKAPKSLAGANINWFNEFKWDKEVFAKFDKSMSILDFDHIIIKGKKGEKVISLTVTDKDVRTSSYSIDVDVEDPNDDNFNLKFLKSCFQPVVASKQVDYTVQVSDKVLCLMGKGEYHKVRYYIMPMEG
jgi:hypothetical protein